MPVYSDSRYRGVNYTSVKFMDGNIKTFLHSRTPVDSEDINTPMKVVHIKEDTMLDLVSENYGGEEDRWWLICDINDILFPLEPEKTEIYIPQKKEFKKYNG